MQKLNYPDMDIVRFYYKNNLQNRAGSVIEFGCGCGNNLKVFDESHWFRYGVDIDKDNIDYCVKNVDGLFQKDDMYDAILEHIDYTGYDVIMFPSSLYYLPFEKIKEIFQKIEIKDGALLFMKMRGSNDDRCKTNDITQVIEFDHTGERGCINTFLSSYEIISVIEQKFELKNKVILRSFWDNLMNGVIVNNHDIIIWGEVFNK